MGPYFLYFLRVILFTTIFGVGTGTGASRMKDLAENHQKKVTMVIKYGVLKKRVAGE